MPLPGEAHKQREPARISKAASGQMAASGKASNSGQRACAAARASSLQREASPRPKGAAPERLATVTSESARPTAPPTQGQSKPAKQKESSSGPDGHRPASVKAQASSSAAVWGNNRTQAVEQSAAASNAKSATSASQKKVKPAADPSKFAEIA